MRVTLADERTLPNSRHERILIRQEAVDQHSRAPIVEVVSAGNEILIGDVLDTNTNWLCTRVTSSAGS